MRKLVLFCLAITACGFLCLAGWSIYNSLQDKKVDNYSRFFMNGNDGRSKKFNFHSLHSPLQTESQEKVMSIVTFSFKVPYPVAPKFKLVDPIEGDKGEILVAGEINGIISDTVKKIKERFMLDYDGTSSRVRNYVNPENLSLSEPEVNLSMFGTASPEASKYGLFESMKPGHFEPENSELAKNRLIRTVGLLKKMGFKAKIVKFGEKQFSTVAEAEHAMKDKKILDQMRYVKVDVIINAERLKVTTATAPILLPIWFLLFSLIFAFIWRLRIPKYRRPIMNFKLWSWSEFWNSFLIFISYLIMISLVLALLIIFSKWIILILAVISLIFIIYLLLEYYKVIWEFISFTFFIFQLIISYLWQNIIMLLKWVWNIIVIFVKWFLRVIRNFIGWILGIIILIIDVWTWIANWWHLKTRCQKTLIIVLLYAIIVTALMVYFWVTRCPC